MGQGHTSHGRKAGVIVGRCVAVAVLFMATALMVAMLVNSADAQPVTPGSTYRDCAECPEMVVIPKGSFTMGAAPNEEAREALAEQFRHRSEPQRAVIVSQFSASRLEVTRGQYRVFAEATRHVGEGCFVWNGTDFEWEQTRNWRNPGYAQDDTHPVVCVSWNDASAYVQWLAQKTGRRYRLLSEAEWEYAARAGTATARYWGDDGNQSCAYANGAAPCNDGYAYTAPGGSYRPNAFGLHDMLGNVGEWTQDCWNANYTGAPADARAWTSGDCAMRAVRGGAWDDVPAGMRSAYRVGSPTVIRLYSRGFRVARDD